ncbi:hypothetical protein H310_02818 [Aphanomyces invadans]|uniref:peptidylprolyl isomerase n=1 Tax=Aphanomyces invadans TaxID=157072 RepID=A0A024ULV1_9STRA|nr:hypothetical protein H310_02818 [Aphanomyces invadans]ETW06603.1 hypothetical protein H310_02818 [Aphanomyces invadans]|eukprot:XP_008864678.1 hypothetical protein H310_02818 [Aphanomyces invadans]
MMPDAAEMSFVGVKVALAGHCKTKGNDAFKANEFRRAEAYYKRGLQFLETPQSCKYAQEELEAVGPMLATLHVNIAACCLQDGACHLDQAILHCTQAIKSDSSNVKAWYRKSQAHLKQKEFALARHDIMEAVRRDPDSLAFRTCAPTAFLPKERARRHRKAFGECSGGRNTSKAGRESCVSWHISTGRRSPHHVPRE